MSVVLPIAIFSIKQLETVFISRIVGISKKPDENYTKLMLCYEFLSGIASRVLKVNCYQRGPCVGGPSAFNSPFGHRSHSHNIRLLDNHLPGLLISLSSLALSWVYRLLFFKSLV